MEIKFNQTAEDVRREWAGDFKPAKVAPLATLPVLKVKKDRFALIVALVVIVSTVAAFMVF